MEIAKMKNLYVTSNELTILNFWLYDTNKGKSIKLGNFDFVPLKWGSF